MSTPLLTPPVTAEDHARGPEDSGFVLVMYGDFECPFCQAAQGVVRRVEARLEGRLRFVFRHFPLSDKHPRARAAAITAESGAAQGRFWETHDALFDARGRLEDRDLARVARSAGIDPRQVAADVAAGAYADRIDADVASGLASGVTGTPGFFANGTPIGGSYDARSLVEALRGR